MRIIGLLGEAGSGKDEAAKYLVADHKFYPIALADPLKIACGMFFGWQPEQLWGGGVVKNTPVELEFARCPNCGTPGPPYEDHDSMVYGPSCVECGYKGWLFSEWKGMLSPRYALQSLGGWGRSFAPTCWVDLALARAKAIQVVGNITADSLAELLPGAVFRDRTTWLRDEKFSPDGIVITDVRYRNEVDAIKAAGGRVARIKRPSEVRGDVTSTGIPGHSSETEQQSILDDELDDIINNSGTLEDLRGFVAMLVHP